MTGKKESRNEKRLRAAEAEFSAAWEREETVTEQLFDAEERLLLSQENAQRWAKATRTLERSLTWRIGSAVLRILRMLTFRGSGVSQGPMETAASIERSIEANGEFVQKVRDRPDPAELVSQARHLCEQDEVEAAEKLLSPWLAFYPRDFSVNAAWAENASSARRWAEAYIRWRSVTARFPSDTKAQHRRRLQAAERATRPPRTRRFSMFSGYMASAMVDPVLDAPFLEPDRRVLGVMDSNRRILVDRYSGDVQPLVSVIMPTRDRLGVIEEAIDSVLAQSSRNWELIVVDDAGSDRTGEYVESIGDERVKLLRMPEHSGLPSARNRGLEEASGELIAYLDSDNTWHPDHVLVMAGVLGERPDLEVAYCAQELWQVSADGEREQTGLRFGPFNRSLLENRNYIDVNSVVHRAEAAQRVGGFASVCPEDWDFLLQLTESRGAIAVPCVLSRYLRREGVVSITGNSEAGSRSADTALINKRASGGPLEVELPVIGPEASSMSGLASPVDESEYARPYAVVVPSFEAEPYLRACVQSVLRFTPESDDWKLIIVDNASGDGVQSYLDEVEGSPRIEILRQDRNLGFTHASNAGIERAGAERDVVLLNNDAIVTPGWTTGMRHVFDDVEDAGLLVPRQVLLPGTRETAGDVPYATHRREVDVTLSAKIANIEDPLLDVRRGYVGLTFAGFFCVYIPRSTIDQVGMLNVEMSPHYRSDRIYCDVVRRFAGKQIVYTPHSKVYHFHHRASTELREADPDFYRALVSRNEWMRINPDTTGPAKE